VKTIVNFLDEEQAAVRLEGRVHGTKVTLDGPALGQTIVLPDAIPNVQACLEPDAR
jgi:hypothetical protein